METVKPKPSLITEHPLLIKIVEIVSQNGLSIPSTRDLVEYDNLNSTLTPDYFPVTVKYLETLITPRITKSPEEPELVEKDIYIKALMKQELTPGEYVLQNLEQASVGPIYAKK